MDDRGVRLGMKCDEMCVMFLGASCFLRRCGVFMFVLHFASLCRWDLVHFGVFSRSMQGDKTVSC